MGWLRTIAAIVAVLALTVTGAFAHAVLTSSDPQDGSRLEHAPEEIVLQFSEPVFPVRMQLAGSGDLTIPELPEADAENNVVRIPVPGRLEPGSYILSYSVTSADGHPVSGSIAFGIGQVSAAAPLSESVELDWLPAINRAVHYAFLLAATGGGLFTLLVLRGQQVPRTLLRGLLAFSAVAALTLVLSVGLNGLQLAGIPVSGLVTWEPWAAGAGTTLLRSAIAGLAGLLLLASGLPRRVSTFGRISIGGGSLLALSSLALTGHAATAPPVWASAPAVYLHGVAAAFWTGSLWPLWVLLDRMTAEDGVRMVRRFSSLAIGLVAALIAAGCLLSLVQLGSLEAVLATPYGWTWAFKVALVVPLVGLAALNRQVLLPNLATKGPAILRRSIVAEAALLAGIVLATSFLGQTPPPRALASEERALPSPIADQGRPAVLEIASGDYHARVEITPAIGGRNTIGVAVSDGTGDPIAAQEVTAVWSLPSAGIEGLARALSPSSDGRFSGEVDLPVTGQWLIQIDVLVSDFEKAVFRAEVEIPGT